MKVLMMAEGGEEVSLRDLVEVESAQAAEESKIELSSGDMSSVFAEKPSQTQV